MTRSPRIWLFPVFRRERSKEDRLDAINEIELLQATPTKPTFAVDPSSPCSSLNRSPVLNGYWMSPINENVVCSENSRVDETLNDLIKTSESKNRDVFVASPQGSKHALMPRLSTQEKFRDEASMNSNDVQVLVCLTPDETIDGDVTTVDMPPTDVTKAYSSPELQTASNPSYNVSNSSLRQDLRRRPPKTKTFPSVAERIRFHRRRHHLEFTPFGQ